MNRFTAHKECRSLMDLYELNDWSFGFNRRKNSLGVCNYDKKEIKLSGEYVEVNSLEVMEQTMLHEIAHALAFLKYGDSVKHDYRWLSIARAIGYTGEQKATGREGLVRPEYKYQYECPSCGKINGYNRKITKQWACRECCIKYNNSKWSIDYVFILKRS